MISLPAEPHVRAMFWGSPQGEDQPHDQLQSMRWAEHLWGPAQIDGARRPPSLFLSEV